PNLDHLQCAGHVHSYWLFAINVLSGPDAGIQVLGMIVRRRGDHYRVHFLGSRELLVGLWTNEKLRSVQDGVALLLLQFVKMRARSVGRWSKHWGGGPPPRPRRFPRRGAPPPAPPPPHPSKPMRTAEFAAVPRTNCGLMNIMPAVAAAAPMKARRSTFPAISDRCFESFAIFASVILRPPA